MQVTGLGISSTVSSLVKAEGIPAFWKGLFFAYGREASYTSIKLGAYAPVRDALGAGKDAPFYLKFLAGAITGGVGSFVGYVSYDCVNICFVSISSVLLKLVLCIFVCGCNDCKTLLTNFIIHGFLIRFCLHYLLEFSNSIA